MIAVDPLMERLGIIRNDLFDVIDIPDDADTTDYAGKWWKELDPERSKRTVAGNSISPAINENQDSSGGRKSNHYHIGAGQLIS